MTVSREKVSEHNPNVGGTVEAVQGQVENTEQTQPIAQGRAVGHEVGRGEPPVPLTERIDTSTIDRPEPEPVMYEPPKVAEVLSRVRGEAREVQAKAVEALQAVREEVMRHAGLRVPEDVLTGQVPVAGPDEDTDTSEEEPVVAVPPEPSAEPGKPALPGQSHSQSQNSE